MNVFMPFESFMESASCLDQTRLRKQRIEIIQVLEACLRESHLTEPVVRMWKGYEIALCHFGLCCCYTWKERGNADNFYAQFQEKLKILPIRKQYLPPWLGQEVLHSAYRAELLEEGPEWYGQFGWAKKLETPLNCLKGVQ